MKDEYYFLFNYCGTVSVFICRAEKYIFCYVCFVHDLTNNMFRLTTISRYFLLFYINTKRSMQNK